MKTEFLGKHTLLKVRKNRDFKFLSNFYKDFSRNLASFSLVADEGPAAKKSKYIFIRLYDPVYTVPINPAELLKKGQQMTDVTGLDVYHAAIGFDLQDKFYGLSFGGKYGLKIEECTNVNSCTYMKGCSPEKSLQYTYAMAVTEKEYEAAKNAVEYYAKSRGLRYTVMHNVPIALYSIKRKFFSHDPQIIDYSQFLSIYKAEFNAKHNIKIKEKFVCSTFCAFILMLCVPAVAQYFVEKEISFNYITPSDLSTLPGMKQIFSGKWIDFKVDAKRLADGQPEFKEYI